MELPTYKLRQHPPVMPARAALRPLLGRGRSRWGIAQSNSQAICLFCSLSGGPATTWRSTGRLPTWPRRAHSTDASSPSSSSSPTEPEAALSDPRKALEDALLALQKHAPNYVNLSRVQLALRNLQQPAGDESIRVAILAMTHGGETGQTAKKLSKLLLADPLKDQDDWETQLDAHDLSQPLIVRVGQEARDAHAVSFVKDEPVPEMNVSSPLLNGNRLELLLMEISPFADSPDESIPALEETVLVPTIEIPTSSTGRFTPITTPVHKVLLVGDGIQGAVSALSFPYLESRDTISAAVNFRNYTSEDTSGLPFIKIDVEAAEEGLVLFRENVSNAMKSGDLWDEANLGPVREWLKSGAVSKDDGSTKEAVRNLVNSLLNNTAAAITTAEAHQLSLALTTKTSTGELAGLDQAVSAWAQSGHEELQEQLDIAFTGRRWRKLGWWKLFWRADDVGMLSSEMISQRFLPQAERGIIYLAGRIREGGVTAPSDGLAYAGPLLAPSSTENGDPPQTPTQELEGKWPTHIPFTRNYLLDTTIPALQALAQKLMIQSLGTSTVTTTLAGLIYFSGYGLYEVGAVAGLGVVWSLRRLQKKWETAREYWQGEVREEGRKALRASEASLQEVLDKATKSSSEQGEEVASLTEARQLVQDAQGALARLK